MGKGGKITFWAVFAYPLIKQSWEFRRVAPQRIVHEALLYGLGYFGLVMKRINKGLPFHGLFHGSLSINNALAQGRIR